MRTPGSNILLEKLSEDELRMEFQQLVAGDTTVIKLAEKYDVSAATVYRALEKLGYARDNEGIWQAPPIELDWTGAIEPSVEDYEQLIALQEPSEAAILTLLTTASHKLREAQGAIDERDSRIVKLQEEVATLQQLCDELNNDAMEWQKEQRRRKEAQKRISEEMRNVQASINGVDDAIHRTARSYDERPQ